MPSSCQGVKVRSKLGGFGSTVSAQCYVPRIALVEEFLAECVSNMFHTIHGSLR